MQENNIEEDINLFVFGINSHVKLYKLCWQINKKLNMNFVKTKNHINPENKNQNFERFVFHDKNSDYQYNIVSNTSKEGWLCLNNKNTNYFLIIEGSSVDLKETTENLRSINDVLLAFHLNLSKIDSITPFIIND